MRFIWSLMMFLSFRIRIFLNYYYYHTLSFLSPFLLRFFYGLIFYSSFPLTLSLSVLLIVLFFSHCLPGKAGGEGLTTVQQEAPNLHELFVLVWYARHNLTSQISQWTIALLRCCHKNSVAVGSFVEYDRQVKNKASHFNLFFSFTNSWDGRIQL